MAGTTTTDREQDLQFEQRVAAFLPLAVEIGTRARAAFRRVRTASTGTKNAVLLELARLLEDETQMATVLAANARDLARADENGLSPALRDRLSLNPKRISAIADALREIAAFPDPVGEVISGGKMAEGVDLLKKRVPLGVVFTVYESRPNVTVDIGALSLKSGNAAILRGGKEALDSNQALHQLFEKALQSQNLPAEAVQLVQQTDRALMTALLAQDALIDIAVPRGGEALIRFVSEHARMPVIKHDKGVCNLFVDRSATLEPALQIAINAKLQRPSVCNAIENILIHKDSPIARELLEGLQKAGARLLGDAAAAKVHSGVEIVADPHEAYNTEFLDERLSVKIVENLDEALDFIHQYGSGHSEGIVSNDNASIERFSGEVDTAAVLVNCSTRFHDGGQMGMGAEVGISTGRMHVRGPMGVRDLTTTTYILRGSGQIRR